MEEDRKIYLFDGTNFNNWCFRMEVHLEELDLVECIRSELEDMPELRVLQSDTANVKQEKEKKLQEVKKKNVKCKSVLVRNIADSQLESIKGKRTPREIWTTLETTFARKGISGQFYLLKRLSAMKFDETGSLHAHLLLFERMVRDLESAGIELQEQLVVFFLLQTMPKSYGQLVTVLETLSVEQCTLEFVKARLLSENVKRENFDDSAVNAESTAFAGKSAKSRFKCFSCGKVGHKRSECLQRFFSGAAKPAKKEKKNQMKQKAYISESEVTFISSCVDQNERLCSVKGFKWILDSGASDHMICCSEYLRDVEKLKEPVMIKIASGQVLHSYHRGKVDMVARVGKRRVKCVVDNVLFVPGLNYNLFSIRRVGELGMQVLFLQNTAIINKNGVTLCIGHRSDRLYVLDVDVKKVMTNKALVTRKMSDSVELWHRRYGHIGKSGLAKLISANMVTGMSLNKEAMRGGSVCGPCMEGKQIRKPFQDKTLPRSSRPLELVHSDVCGAITPAAWNGKRYFVTFTDDYTHFCAVYLLSTKDEVLDRFKTYVAMAEAHFDSSVSRLRCDNGGEYVSRAFADFCRGKGIQMEFTVPYTPQQNGVSERLNRTILDKARAMIADSGLNRNMWNEAVNAAVYLINRSPTAALTMNKTPYESWYRHKPDVSKIRIFGSKAYSLIPKQKRGKLESRSKVSYLVGYGGGGYRLWDGKKIFIARDVVVDEQALLPKSIDGDSIDEAKTNSSFDCYQLFGPSSSASATGDTQNPSDDMEVSGQQSRGPMISESENSDEEEFDEAEDGSFNENSEHTNKQDADANIDLRRSKRVRKPPGKLDDYLCIAFALNAETFVENVPETIEELQQLEDWPEWKKAIDREMASLAENNTWCLVDMPVGCKPVDCKWVFRLKLAPDGSIEKRKARLVAKGFSQRHGFDFSETYAPVVRMATVRSMLAFANQHDFVIHQMDVTSAFLNGVLTENIYMRQPKGFEEGDKVCKLNKSLYGLKQASRAWNDRFNEFIGRCGFRRCDSDNCLYVRQSKSGPVFLLLYVDDVLLIANAVSEITVVKRLLRMEFKMQDLGDVRVFLNMKIERDPEQGVMKLSQPHYVDAVLKRFGMEACKPSTTPMEAGLQLEKSDAKENLGQPYRELIGCLTYLAVTSRPDLSAAVSYFSQFQSNPSENHWIHAKRMLRYLRGTPKYGLVFNKKELCHQIVGFADANWATDINDRHSVTGYLIQVFGATTAWSTRKQRTVALSSTEAECCALVDCICETLWICKLFGELGIRDQKAAQVFEDNQSAIAIAESDGPSRRLKHTDVKLHFIKECVRDAKVDLCYIPSADQPADCLTKGLTGVIFNKHRSFIGIQE